MKNILSIIAVVLFNITTYCQTQLTNKNGVPLFPEAGEYGFGIDAMPILNFLGELTKINSDSDFNNPLEFKSSIAPQFYLKYYKSSKTAYRFKFRVALHRENNTYAVVNDLNTDQIIYDERLEYYYMLDIGLGLEKRKGLNRIQGFYGLEAHGILRNGDDIIPNYKYTYANEITTTNTAPSTALFLDGNPRPTVEKSGVDFGFGVRAFFGIEFFFAPKMAVGGEIGYNFTYIKEGKGNIKTEVWDATGSEILVDDVDIKNGSEISLDVEQGTTGIVYFIFHF